MVSLLGFSLRGTRFVLSNMLLVTASSPLLLRYYQAVITRLCYIALLFYGFYIGAKYYSHVSPMLLVDVTTGIFAQLIGSKWTRNEELSWDGQHWTLNIAENILSAAFSLGIARLFPAYIWPFTIVATLWNLFRPVHLVELWLQKQITRLVRFDRKTWKWSLLVFESACQSMMRLVNFQATRSIVDGLWWMCYQFTIRVNQEAVDRWVDSLFIMSLILWSNPNRIYLWYIIHGWGQYRLWIQNLGPFANPNPPEHAYMPLKDPEDIRMLLLLPRFAFRPICCSLVHGQHMKLVFYEAISYTWDSGDKTEEILVDGCRKKVTKSVYEVLASYSSLLLPKVLWIDALCIDQENNAEKSEQVSLMAKIYRNALITTVFLGRSPLAAPIDLPDRSLLPYRYDGVRAGNKEIQTHFEEASLAFDLLNEFRVLESALKHSRMSIYQHFSNLQFSKSQGRQWEALLKLLRHPVFERVWVVQEVALSDHVQVRYGDEVIDWKFLANGIEMLQKSSNFQLWLEWTYKVDFQHLRHTSVYNIIRMQRFRQGHHAANWSDWDIWMKGWDTGLPNLLAESFYFKATDPCDLIYGLMSLCRDPIKVSYGNTAADVFLAAARELIQRGALHLLLHAAGVGNRLEPTSIGSQLPSWVPDWTDAPRYKSLGPKVREPRAWEPLEGKLEAKPAIELKGNRTLIFWGKFIDTIVELGPVIFNMTHQAGERTEETMVQLAENYESCWRLIQNSTHTADPYPYAAQDQSLRGAFRRSIMINEGGRRWDQSLDQVLNKIPEWEEMLKLFRQKPLATLKANGDELYKLLQDTYEIAELIRSQCGGRRLFISKNGYIGLCPPYTQREDLIYFVPGLTVPIILRSYDDDLKKLNAPRGSATSYRLVGDCYTHGLMEGGTALVGTLENGKIV